MDHKKTGHLSALVTILTWGSTFVVTKVLLDRLTATQILTVRFLAAGLVLVPFARGFFRWAGWKTEARWMAAGLTGVTAYYLAENTALALTRATDVGLIVTVIPLLTTLAAAFVTRGEKLSVRVWAGTLTAFAGVFAVMGKDLSLGQSPTGDLMALGAALAFTAYSLVIRKLPPGTPALVTVARSFLWGVVFSLPVLGFDGGWPRWEVLGAPEVLGPLAFLVLAASGAAYALWNRSIRILGPVKTNNYIYLVPLVNTVLGALVLGEPVTPETLLGCGLIVGGVVLGSCYP